jgi:hypothetical protein
MNTFIIILWYNIVILWDHCCICGLSLAEMLSGTWLTEDSLLLTHGPRTVFTGYQLPYALQTWQGAFCGSEDCSADQL